MRLDGLEVRLAVRRLFRAPAFAVSIICLFAISIGATTFTFTVVRALLFQSIPYSDAERLVVLAPGAPRGEMVDEIALRRDLFEVSAYVERAANIAADGWADRVLTARITPNFLAVTGTRPTLGRSFVAEDFSPAHEPVVIVTDRLWRQRYNGARELTGQLLTIDGRAATIVGVLPTSFRTIGQLERAHDVVADRDVQVFLPLRGSTHAFDPGSTDKVGREAQVLARLSPGQSVSRINNELRQLLDAAQSRYRYPVPFRFKSLRSALAGQLPAQLALLSAGVGMLLLVGCANVLNLLLARIERRRGELAICTALGADPGRIVSSVLVETCILSTIGGAAGLLLSWQATVAARALAGGMIDLGATGPDTAVLLFTLTLCTALAIGVGIVPGVAAARRNPLRRLQGAVTQSGTAKSALRSSLVIAQTALAVALVIVGALLARAFVRLLDDNGGYTATGVLSAEVSLGRSSMEPGAFFAQVMERAATIPEFDGAAVVSTTPGGEFIGVSVVIVRGQPVYVETNDVSGEYFRVLSIPMLAGGTFTPRDTRTTPPVVVVNEAFARQYYSSAAEAAGQQFALRVPSRQPRGVTAGAIATIVGVVANVRDRSGAGEPAPKIYMNYMQSRWPSGQMTVLVRATNRNASAAAAALRGIVAGVDPEQPLYNVRPLSEIRRSRFARDRVIATVMGAFSVTTLLVAALGVYAAMSFAGATRRHEIGVRLALGGSRWSIVRTITWSGAKLVGIGLEAGLALAVMTIAALRASLFDTWHIDVMTTSAAVALVIVVAGVALLVPALRATGLDPLPVLRE